MGRRGENGEWGDKRQTKNANIFRSFQIGCGNDVEKYLKSKILHELKALKYELYAVITHIISLKFK